MRGEARKVGVRGNELRRQLARALRDASTRKDKERTRSIQGPRTDKNGVRGGRGLPARRRVEELADGQTPVWASGLHSGAQENHYVLV